LLAVTTFSPEGYLKYGSRCLEGLKKHFPGRVVSYCEEKIGDSRLFFSIPGTKEYIEKISKVTGADGKSHGAEYSYQFDASKFCRKVFVQNHVFDEDELVFWFDADCVIQKDIPEHILRTMLERVALAYMGRDGIGAYTETGFLGFNTKHPQFQKFRDAYLDYFLSGRIFAQTLGWHDCIAFDHARKGVSARNLSPNSTMGAVIQKTVLGEYVRHLKGPRKFAPSSLASAAKTATT
jgi:hypothetical protein